MTIANCFLGLAKTPARPTMNYSTSEIIDHVFQEYTTKIVSLSAKPRDTEGKLNEMKESLMERFYTQYYNNTSRFMTSVDLDDVFSSSPPKEQMIKKYVPDTPQK